MRVLILSQYYTPEPVPKPWELAGALADRGHSVSVVTGFPNYPSGKLYPGFRLGLVKRETIDGIPIIRTYEYPYHGKSVVGRVLNYVSFMLSAPLGSFFAPQCDAIYVWHPPLTIGLSAWLIARMRRVPFVYDVQDIWPEAALVSGLLKRGWLVSLMDKLEKFVYRRADYLLVVTDGARENLISKGVPAAKISVLPHWVEESLFEHSAENTGLSLREKYGWKDRFVVLFAGNIGIVQGLEVVVRAASELQTSIQAQGSGDALIALVGDGSDKSRLQALADQMGLQNIHFIDRQPMERMPEFMKAADALLVHLKKSEFSRHAIPGKTLAYLAAGKPILMAVEGAAAKLVTEAGAGLVVSPEDPVALANAICSVIAAPESERAMMGERGRQYLMENLSKQKVISQYEKVLQRAASQNGQ